MKELKEIHEFVDKINFANFTHTETIFLLTKLITKAGREVLGQSMDITYKEIEYVFCNQLQDKIDY